MRKELETMFVSYDLPKLNCDTKYTFTRNTIKYKIPVFLGMLLMVKVGEGESGRFMSSTQWLVIAILVVIYLMISKNGYKGIMVSNDGISSYYKYGKWEQNCDWLDIISVEFHENPNGQKPNKKLLIKTNKEVHVLERDNPDLKTFKHYQKYANFERKARSLLI